MHKGLGFSRWAGEVISKMIGNVKIEMVCFFTNDRVNYGMVLETLMEEW